MADKRGMYYMKRKRFTDIMWGIILLLIAAGLVLSRFDVPGMDFFETVSMWKILAGTVFALLFIQGVRDRSYAGSLFSLAFLLMVFSKELHIEVLVPWTILIVALLASIALNLIFGSSHRRSNKNRNRNRNNNNNHNNNSNNNNNANGSRHGNNGFCSSNPGGGCQGDNIDGERVFEKVTFGSAVRYVNSDNLQYADISCSFGGIEIYFDNARVPSGQAAINISSNFSGVDIYIPKEWKVINEMASFCGGVDIDNGWTGDSSVVITLTGRNNFGGVGITRV